MPTPLSTSLPRVFAAAGLPPGAAEGVLRGESPPGLDARCLALIATDPPGVQELVLASRRPLTVLGASAALAAWDAALEERPELACVFAGGGQSLLLAPLDQADAIVASLKAQFKETLFTNLGAAVLPISGRELSDPRPGFGRLVEALHLLLRAAQSDDARPGMTLPQPGEKRCVECATRAGTQATAQGAVCLPCARFGDRGRTERQHWGLEDHGSILDLLPPGQSHAAFLAIDGTGMGAALRRQDTLRDYHRFSRALHRAFDTRALRELMKSKLGISRVLPVLRGGDDLLLIFQGRGAPEAALALLQSIEDTLRRELPGESGLGAGAGLVLSGHMTALDAMSLARKLVRSAKDGAKLAKLRSGFDFEVVYGGAVLADSVEEMRAERTLPLPAFGASPPGSLTLGARPLALPQARELLDCLGTLEGTELSALRRMVEALQEEPLGGLITAGYLLARQTKARGSPLSDRLNQQVAPWNLSQLGAQGLVLRRAGDQRFVSSLPELLDLHKFKGDRP